MDHVKSGVIGRGQIHPKFITTSCQTSNVVIYLQRNDNPGRLPELVKTLGFLTARVRDDNTLELELIATSLIYKGCGSTMMNTFLQSARDAGFEHLYLYSLLSPLPFYQSQNLSYLGHTKEDPSRDIKQKDYMIMNLQTNNIRNFDITSIVFDPPRPGTEIKVPTHNQLMSFMTPNQPYSNINSEDLKEIRSMFKHRKTTKNGKKYLNKNSYSSFLSRKRSAEEPKNKGAKRFKKVVRKVMNKMRSRSKV
jgi:hypothetical protein